MRFWRVLCCCLSVACLASHVGGASRFAAWAAAVPPPATTEPVLRSYAGVPDYAYVIGNIGFDDISGAWSEEAILEGGALGFVKGFGAGSFGRQQAMSNAQAIAMAVRAGGLEAQAQAAGEAMEAAARGTAQATGAPAPPSASETVWVNGSLTVAAGLGMITGDELASAMGDGQALARTGFSRGGQATRQRFVHWLALAVGIPPTRGQQALFNNFADWRDADALLVPYLETALAQKIISGNSDGTFQPMAPVTREQAAQIVMNAKGYVYRANGYEEFQGIVERIQEIGVDEGAIDGAARAVYYIRRDDGSLDAITVDKQSPASAAAKGDGSQNVHGTGLVVTLQGDVGDDSLLYEGDRIRFVTARPSAAGQPRAVAYASVIEPARRVDYALAQLDAIDAAAGKVAYTQIFAETRGTAEEVKTLDDVAGDGRAPTPQAHSRSVSGDIAVKSAGRSAALSDLAVGMSAIVGVDAQGLVVSIETTGIGYQLGMGGVVKGVVEENNPALGYLSLYDENGARGEGGDALRVYGYATGIAIETSKDGAKASIEDVAAGDSAYVVLDESGMVAAVGAVTNYKLYYGEVVSVDGASAVIRYDSGELANLELGEGVLYFSNYASVGKEALVPGAWARVLATDAGGRAVAREVTIARADKGRGALGGIYKARLERVDAASQKAIVYNVMRFDRGQWVKEDSRGFGAFAFVAGSGIYAGDDEVSVETFNRMLRDSEAYIATRAGYGDEQPVDKVFLPGRDSFESLYDASVRQVRPSSGLLSLNGGPAGLSVVEGTIVVKDGALAGAQAIAADDRARVAAVRDDATGELRAAVVEIVGGADVPPYSIYRGRVKSVDRDRSISLESFSELIGTEWAYANTAKTLAVTYDTALLAEGGLTPARELDGPVGQGLAGQSVYVVARGNDALAISVASFGLGQTRGEIRALEGALSDEFGQSVDGPTGVELRDASAYDRAKQEWGTARAYGTLFAITPATIVIKGGDTVPASELEAGDSVLAVRGEATADTATAYILIVEG